MVPVTRTVSIPTTAPLNHAACKIVWGDRDAFVPREDQARLAAAIPDSRLVVYEGAGHAVHWEQPERVAADIVAFVERLAW